MAHNISIEIKKINQNNNAEQNRVNKLSKRELEVLTCSAFGMTSETTGEALGISKRTVEIHRFNLLKKLSAKNVPDAVRIVMSFGAKFECVPSRKNGMSNIIMDYKD